MDLISSGNYSMEMSSRVLPYLAVRKEAGLWERTPGQRLYYERFRADRPKAAVVLLHGFSEAVDKFYETVYYFLTEGFSVWLFQQREHGRSFRSTQDPTLINIENYEDLILDLKGFVSEKVQKDPEAAGLPMYFFGHSMGGGVGACFLERYPDVFSKAVLSSPMLETSSGAVPKKAAEAYAKLMIRRGKGRDPMPGSGPFSGEPDFENACTDCRERYDYWFRQQLAHTEYQMCVCGFRTGYELNRLTKEVMAPENCRHIKADILMMQAGKETMVKNSGQDLFTALTGGHVRKVVFPEAKHEIYLSADKELEQYWQLILEFLG